MKLHSCLCAMCCFLLAAPAVTTLPIASEDMKIATIAKKSLFSALAIPKAFLTAPAKIKNSQTVERRDSEHISETSGGPKPSSGPDSPTDMEKDRQRESEQVDERSRQEIKLQAAAFKIEQDENRANAAHRKAEVARLGDKEMAKQDKAKAEAKAKEAKRRAKQAKKEAKQRDKDERQRRKKEQEADKPGGHGHGSRT